MKAINKWLNRLFGLDFPAPREGQQWRSAWNGDVMRVERVEVDVCGGLTVVAENCREGDRLYPRWGMTEMYARGIHEWRCRLKEERRGLLSDLEALPEKMIVRSPPE